MSFLISAIKSVAYLSLPFIICRQASASSPTARYYIRLGVYLGCMTAVATWAAFVAAGLFLVGRRFDVNYIVARTFYALAGTVLGIKLEIEGAEHLDTKPAVLMHNHQSMLDILFVAGLIPKRTSIMSKKSLQFSPLGPFMLMSGAIFIDRGDNTKAVQSLKAAGEQMKNEKLSLWLFPEGTRHSAEEPSLLPFKKGGFHLAIQCGLPIVPVVTENYWRLYHKGVFESGVVKVKVLPPILTSGLKPEDAAPLALRVRDQMVEALREISVKIPGPAGLTEKSSQDQPAAVPEQSSAVHRDSTQVSESGVVPEKEEERDLLPSSSTSSLADSMTSSKYQASENGTETEEDEGMVLVGRPQ